MKSVQQIEEMAKNMRKDVFRMALNSGTKGAHIGGSMSCMEILAVLYGNVMKYDANLPFWEFRDRFIMSKAHSAIGLYAALHQAGYLTDEDIEGALHGDSELYKHPRYDIQHGFEASGGSLGQGLSFAVGNALALKWKGNTTSRVFVLLGDGECDEGSIWEAAASIIHFGLNQIVTIVDRNRLQNDGTTEQVMDKSRLTDRWKSMGFTVLEVNGHRVDALMEAFNAPAKTPKVIIADTVKGKGCSFAENVVDWHIAYFTKELYKQAMEELK